VRKDDLLQVTMLPAHRSIARANGSIPAVLLLLLPHGVSLCIDSNIRELSTRGKMADQYPAPIRRDDAAVGNRPLLNTAVYLAEIRVQVSKRA
jgi:hypothetical protein